MAERLMDPAAIGERLSGKSPKTGKRFMDQGHIPVYLVGRHRNVKESEFNDWLERQRIETVTPQPNSLKAMLEKISESTLSRRKATA